MITHGREAWLFINRVLTLNNGEVGNLGKGIIDGHNGCGRNTGSGAIGRGMRTGSSFCGHSFFQCPFCMQMRQKELAIRLASEPGPANCDLPLPFPGPFFPEPLSNLQFTGQKPRTLTRSLSLLRASWYVEQKADSS